MRKKVFRIFFILLFSFVLNLPAQDATTGIVPHVSGLQGEVRNNLVRLTWQDSSLARGYVYIYRWTFPVQEVTAAPISISSGIVPVIVPYGVQSFIDDLEYEGYFYYYVAASNEEGRIFDQIIENENFTSVHVALGLPVPVAQIPEITPILLDPDGISLLTAESFLDRVIINFNQRNVSRAVLYRSIRPITHTTDLLRSVIIENGIQAPFLDFPVPGIPYYYAVINEDDLIRGTVSIIPGINSTEFPVTVSVSREGRPVLNAPLAPMRIMPLPELGSFSITQGSVVPEDEIIGLNSQAGRVLRDIGMRPAPAVMAPLVFAADMQRYPAGGENFALSTIVTGSFVTENWERAREELNGFLALPRSPEAAARARFYLGQCYYFLNQPRNGLFEFLLTQDLFPAESREWIQASLELMRN